MASKLFPLKMLSWHKVDKENLEMIWSSVKATLYLFHTQAITSRKLCIEQVYPWLKPESASLDGSLTDLSIIDTMFSYTSIFQFYFILFYGSLLSCFLTCSTDFQKVL
ncbi:40S ribosomal protein S4-like protein isoform X2 [Iris pallida]|uniref:40S ribosomal protein S4-like protein isoform X2 n=1 Tax=Iris pallida TaxID=29817 RepID=A0AAX6IBH8_IRIPA|nr:40S ribosomal protein S4-like protein isoform X2 [Iris pallida]KAJ6852054.1 40S ribosomal protein S4-like protein isoform X2 [Iris pallida]